MKKGLLKLAVVVTVFAALMIGGFKPTTAFLSQATAGGAEVNGTVVETMNTVGYTYVQVDTGKEKIWAAGPEREIKVGDKVIIPTGMVMEKYHSKTLNRDFDKLYFVSAIVKEGETAGGSKAGMSSHGMSAPAAKSEPPATVKAGSIKKAANGNTVEEIFATKQKLAGKKVTVRGQVVKFAAGIMGKNWLHIQDGTGKAGTNDLTITTSSTAKNGDMVLVSGVLAVDKDFGHGYKYDVIIEDANVKVE